MKRVIKSIDTEYILKSDIQDYDILGVKTPSGTKYFAVQFAYRKYKAVSYRPDDRDVFNRQTDTNDGSRSSLEVLGCIQGELFKFENQKELVEWLAED